MDSVDDLMTLIVGPPNLLLHTELLERLLEYLPAHLLLDDGMEGGRRGLFIRPGGSFTGRA